MLLVTMGPGGINKVSKFYWKAAYREGSLKLSTDTVSVLARLHDLAEDNSGILRIVPFLRIIFLQDWWEETCMFALMKLARGVMRGEISRKVLDPEVLVSIFENEDTENIILCLNSLDISTYVLV